MSSGDPSNGIREERSLSVRPRGQHGDAAASLVARGGEGMAPPLCMHGWPDGGGKDSQLALVEKRKAKRQGLQGRDGAEVGPVDENS